MNYVTEYQKRLGLFFDSKIYQVHHIDMNRENNEIENLVLVPTLLHQKFHSVGMFIPENIPNFFSKDLNVCSHIPYSQDWIIDFITAKEDMLCFVDLRNSLIKNIIPKNDGDFEKIVQYCLPTLWNKYCKE